MDFRPDENQRAVAELAADVLRKERDTDPGELDAQLGYDPSVWAALAKVGLLALAVPTELGGDGLGVAEVMTALREIAMAGARVPGIATLALGVLTVSAHGSAAQQADLLTDVAAGTTLLTGAPNEPGHPLSERPLTAATRVTDGWRLTGVKVAVPYAEQAATILVPAATPEGYGVFLVGSGAAGITLSRTHTATGQPEYTVGLADVFVPDSALLGGDDTGITVRTLREHALAAAVSTGAGALAGALELTTEHVRTRHQFGKPLAAFQAVAQQIADVYIAARTMQLAALSASWRLASGLDAAEGLALAGYWLATEALPAVRTCHHLHGGLGADITYPLHRYYRTIKDSTRLMGGRQHMLESFGAEPTGEPVPGDPTGEGMFIELTTSQRALQDELRAYFAQLMTDEERAISLIDRHGPVYHEVVHRMGRDGRLGVGWPTAFGGHGFGAVEQHIFVNEASRADVQLPSVTLQTVGPTLQEFGTEEQKAFFLPKILAGEVHFAIGYSEPDNGTDLAGLRATAVRDGDHYIVNGQKTWTTGGHAADYIWLAVRTDPEAPKHKGISILIVDTRDPGFSSTPIITVDGAHHVNATYYENVRVPVNMLVGEENRGWHLIVTQLNHERVMLGPSGRVGGLYDKMHVWATAGELLDLPDVRAALAQTRAIEGINELLNWQVAATDSNSSVDVADASATKVFGSEHIQHLYDLTEELLARHGDLTNPATAHLAAWLDTQAKRNIVLTFGGGVNEVQRELIASAGLALPRVPR